MSDDVKLSAPEGVEIAVNFPFIMKIDHAPLDVSEMFVLTKALDLYEMQKNLAEPGSYVKDQILIDVLECSPTQTTIKVTPADSLPYTVLAKYTEFMLKTITKQYLKGKSKVALIKWEIDKTGVASDLRGMLRKVS